MVGGGVVGVSSKYSCNPRESNMVGVSNKGLIAKCAQEGGFADGIILRVAD